MSPSRHRHLATLAAMLEHAKAETAEGRSARGIAAKFKAEHCITDAELNAWRESTDDQARAHVEFPGWEQPWMFGILSAVGVIYRCQVMLANGPKVVVRGRLAGKAARRAEDVRRRVDALVARNPDFGALPIVVPGVYMATSATAYTSHYFAVQQIARTSSLAAASGKYLDDTYRGVLVRNMLVDEVRAALAAVEKEAREAQRGARAAPPPTVQGGSGWSGESTSGQEESVAPQQPDAALLAASRRLDEANAVLARVLQSRPAWAAKNPEEADASLACLT